MYYSILTTNSTNQVKSFSLKNGELVKSSVANAYDGKFTQYSANNIVEFAKHLYTLTNKQTVILGTPHKQNGCPLALGESVPLTTKKNYTPKAKAIPRSKDHVQNINRSGFCLFDFDGNQYGYLELIGFIPELENVQAVIKSSSSSFIYDKQGNELIGDKGRHIYFAVKNMADIERIAGIFCGRQWLAGYGHYVLSGGITPKLLERGLFDAAVLGRPERLAFEAKPILHDGLVQRSPDSKVIGGGVLDTSLIQDLTADELERIEQLKQQAKELVKPAHKIATKKAKRDYIANSGKSAKEALKDYKKLQHGVLSRDFELHTAKGIIKAGDLTSQHDGLTMCEPLDRAYDGGSLTKAKFFWNDGNPIINSQAHGGIVYTIGGDSPALTTEKSGDIAIYNALVTAKENKDDYVVIGKQVFFLSKPENFKELYKDYFVNGFDIKVITKPFSYLLQLIKYAPTCHLNRLGNRLAFIIADEVPRRYSIMAAVDFVLSQLAKRGNDGSKVKTLAIITKQVKKRIEALKIRNKITSKQGIYKANFFESDNSTIAKVIVNHGLGKIWLDNRNLGEGKTKLLEQLRLLLDEQSIAYVCHRVSLTKDAAGRLGLTSYHDTEPSEAPKLLAVCVNSATKYRLASYQILFIDEFRQTLEHIFNGTVDNRKECLATLIHALERADLVMCSDADLNDVCVRFLKKHCGGKPINLIETTPTPNSKTIHLLPNHDATYQAIADELKAGGYPFVACTSKTEAVKLNTFLNEHGFKDGLLIHSKNRGEDSQSEFLDSPNDALFNEYTDESDRYSYIIHSPTIGSGVSIETKHFTTNYFLHAGNLPSNEALQMTARNRCANDIYVSFSAQRIFDRVTDLELLQRGEIKKADRLPDLFTPKHGGGCEFTELATLRIESKRAINEDLNDFANNFLLLAELNGYAIKRDLADEAPEADTKGLATRVKEQIVSDIFEADIITPETAKTLENKQAPTQVDSDQLDRFKTTVMAGIDAIADDDVKNFVDGAMPKLTNYETAHASLFECKQYDTKNACTENKYSSKVSIHELFKITIKPILDEGVIIDKVTAAAFCEVLQSNAAELAANGLGNYDKKTFTRPARTLGNFIKRYGYELERISDDGRGNKTYKIQPISCIEKYAKQRKNKQP